MTAAKSIYIYVDSENGDEIFRDIESVLKEATGGNFEFKRLSKDEVSDLRSPWIANCVALFIHNRGGEEKFDKTIRTNLVEYFLTHGGKLVFLCDPDEGRSATWFLRAITEYGKTPGSGGEWPEQVGAAFEKFARGESTIPTNLHALRIDRGDQKYTECSVGLVRGDANMTYAYLTREDEPGTVVFVSGRLDRMEASKSGRLWRDVMRVLRLIGIEAGTPRSPETCRMDAPCFGNPHVLIYTGPDDQSKVYEMISAVISPLIGRKYKVAQLTHTDLISPISPCPWYANCVALFVHNDGGHSKFDDAVQRAMARYVLSSGRIVLFCNPDDGPRATWLLNRIDPTVDDESTAADGTPRGQWSDEIGRAFAKFVKNEPFSNVRTIRMKKDDEKSDYSVGMVKASDDRTPYLYLRCDDGDTAVFVGARTEDAVERSVPVWLDILRLVGIGPEL